jgi:CPA2 family monovalent cation:H+ antiporter-2
MSGLSQKKEHVIVCGYGIVGKFVADNLDKIGASYIVVDNSPKHVNEAIRDNREVYLGDMSKRAILEALHAKESSSIIVTLDNPEKKRLICEAIARNTKDINLIVKIISLEEREALQDLPITVMIDGKEEVARILVERMTSCNLQGH